MSFEGRAAVTTYDRKGAAKVVSYEQMKEDAFAVARALFENGLAGRHVAILGENSYDWLSVYLGSLSAAVRQCVLIQSIPMILL